MGLYSPLKGGMHPEGLLRLTVSTQVAAVAAKQVAAVAAVPRRRPLHRVSFGMPVVPFLA